MNIICWIFRGVEGGSKDMVIRKFETCVFTFWDLCRKSTLMCLIKKLNDGGDPMIFNGTDHVAAFEGIGRLVCVWNKELILCEWYQKGS